MNEQRDRPCLLVLITFFFVFRENANSGESFMNGKVGICLNPMVQLEFGCCTFHFPCLRSIQSYFVKPTGFFSFLALLAVCFFATAHYFQRFFSCPKVVAWLLWLCKWTTRPSVLFVWPRCVLVDRQKMWAAERATLRGTVGFPQLWKGCLSKYVVL